jgi:hypothetical protein
VQQWLTLFFWKFCITGPPLHLSPPWLASAAASLKSIREYCEMAQEKEQEIKAVWHDLLQAGAGA